MRRGLFFTLSVWLVGATMIRATLLVPHQCPAVTPESALFAANQESGWIERAQLSDGGYVYEYNRAEDSEPGGYNVVRHAGVTMSLYQLAAAGEPSVLPAADRGLQFMIDNLYRHDGLGRVPGSFGRRRPAWCKRTDARWPDAAPARHRRYAVRRALA